MYIQDLMNKNEIELDWIFTHGRLHGKEGLVFFEVDVETEKVNDVEQEFQIIKPKCILIDGARFNYSSTMDNELEINTKNDNVIFNRIDGLEVSISIGEFKEMPFKLTEFGSKPIKQGIPDGHVEID